MALVIFLVLPTDFNRRLIALVFTAIHFSCHSNPLYGVRESIHYYLIILTRSLVG